MHHWVSPRKQQDKAKQRDYCALHGVTVLMAPEHGLKCPWHSSTNSVAPMTMSNTN